MENTLTNDTPASPQGDQPTSTGAFAPSDSSTIVEVEQTGPQSPAQLDASAEPASAATTGQSGVQAGIPTETIPATSQDVASEPVASEPVASEPVASEPVASEPVAPEAPVAAAARPVAASAAPAGGDGRAPRQPSMEQVMEMDEFAAYMSGAETLTRNMLLQGTVVRLEDNGSVLIDIGHKSEGIVPRNEVGDDEIEVGSLIECVVIRPEDEEGHPILSKRRADFERQKREIAAAKDTGQVFQATVKEAVKGGIIVDLGVAAFVPASHVDQRLRSNLDRLIGQVLPVKVIEVDFRRNRDKVIASHRLAAAEEREEREAEAWGNIEKDKIMEGVVRRITDFGAFVDLGGIDGLLHVREMAWGRVDHPNSVVKKGQKIQVLVLDINEDNKRIALGLKQLLPDPWKKAARNYKVGQTVTAKVLRIAPTVAFVELEPGVEAIIPIGEMSEERIRTPEDAVSIGQEVEGRIKSIQINQRRITMSLRAAVQERERRETRSAMREVNQRAEQDGPLRLGDLFGKELRALRNRRRDEARGRAEDEEDELDYEETELDIDETADPTASEDSDFDETPVDEAPQGDQSLDQNPGEAEGAASDAVEAETEPQAEIEPTAEADTGAEVETQAEVEPAAEADTEAEAGDSPRSA